MILGVHKTTQNQFKTLFFAGLKNIKNFSIWVCRTYGFTNVSGGISDRCHIAGFVIGISIGTTEVVDNQLLITMIFLVLIWPFNFGPLSDSVGENRWFTWVLRLFILR
jgi:hypothetical protein